MKKIIFFTVLILISFLGNSQNKKQLKELYRHARDSGAANYIILKSKEKKVLDKKIKAFERCLKTYVPQLFDCPIEDLLNEEGIAAKAFSRHGKVSIEVLFMVLISYATNGQSKSLASNLLSIWSSVNGNFPIPKREAVAKYLGFICPVKLKARILIDMNSSEEILTYWFEVGKEIYKQGR